LKREWTPSAMRVSTFETEEPARLRPLWYNLEKTDGDRNEIIAELKEWTR